MAIPEKYSKQFLELLKELEEETGNFFHIEIKEHKTLSDISGKFIIKNATRKRKYRIEMLEDCNLMQKPYNFSNFNGIYDDIDAMKRKRTELYTECNERIKNLGADAVYETVGLSIWKYVGINMKDLTIYYMCPDRDLWHQGEVVIGKIIQFIGEN